MGSQREREEQKGEQFCWNRASGDGLRKSGAAPGPVKSVAHSALALLSPRLFFLPPFSSLFSSFIFFFLSVLSFFLSFSFDCFLFFLSFLTVCSLCLSHFLSLLIISRFSSIHSILYIIGRLTLD